MSTQTLQPERALRIIPSDYADIPFPDKMCSGSVTNNQGGGVLDCYSDISFSNAGIMPGDIMYFPNDNLAVTVLYSNSENTIAVNAEIDPSDGAFIIYKGGLNRGCTLYVGNPLAGLRVTTAGGDVVDIINPSVIVPIQVTRVHYTQTDSTDIIALW